MSLPARRLLPLVWALWLCSCYGTTYSHLRPGDAPRAERLILVGSLRTVPPIQQHQKPMSTRILPGPTRGHFYALFTSDLREPWKEGQRLPLEHHESASLPFDGFFFLEVPAGGKLYLRGLGYQTDLGWDTLEVPLELNLSGAQGVVYVGAHHLVRVPPIHVETRGELEAARREAEARGHGPLLQQRWQVRLAKPVKPGTIEL